MTTRRTLAIHAPGTTSADGLFDPSSPANRDDCLRGFRALRNSVGATGGRVHTTDVFEGTGEAPDVVLFLDIPVRGTDPIAGRWPDAERWVVLQECEVVLRHNWDRARHAEFERLFTWHPDWIDGERYLRLDFANDLRPREFPEQPAFADRRLATLVAGNKRSNHPLELYSARREVIRWYERNAPDDFRFFGIGWDHRSFAGPLRPLNRARRLTRAIAPAWPSWGGPVDHKLHTISRFRFGFCYENAREIPGYVTEKLFDVCRAGAVPVYWGAPDITDHVPADCFIDRRDFPNLASLHEHIADMDEATHMAYLDRIRAFLASDLARLYSADHFGAVVADVLGR